MKNTFEDFTKAIGQRFKVVDNDGKPFSGLLGEHDIIIATHPQEETVEGNAFIAHYSLCRFIQEQPEQLKKGI